jgi:hypothetical protein
MMAKLIGGAAVPNPQTSHIKKRGGRKPTTTEQCSAVPQ